MIDPKATLNLHFTELKRQTKAIDLAFHAARKRQSPRTGFVHFFPMDETVSDTIPIFENFCFVLALFRQKTAETVLEGKELMDRLLDFQAPNGNFPIYLHEYPRTWDKLMPLKIAPVLVQILRHFGSVLNSETKEKIEKVLSKALKFMEGHILAPLWQHRYLRLLGKPTAFTPATAEEWFETIVSDQLSQEPVFTKNIPYNSKLQVFTGDLGLQEKGEPRAVVVEWLCAESEGYLMRLLRDHPHQIYAALLFPLASEKTEDPSTVLAELKNGGMRILWGGSSLHSLVIPSGKIVHKEEKEAILDFDLDQTPEWGREDLFEILAFCDLSSETNILIEGQRGTVFSLGQKILIHTPFLQIELLFTLIEGTADFCGQISRANRPNQIACQKNLLYEVFDWQIGLRTLRRSASCKVRLKLIMT